MITYSCDVCSKSQPAQTALSQFSRALPKGWASRTGVVPHGKSNVGVYVVTCGPVCAKAYDRLEVEAVGLGWSEVTDELTAVFPLKP